MWINRRDWHEQQRELVRLREEILRWRDSRDELNRELGGLRTQNVQLHRDNAQLAHQMELVIVQLAVANDERVALLRSRGVPVSDTPTFHVEHPGAKPAEAAKPIWNGVGLDDEDEQRKTLAALESGAAASLFEDPGDDVAEALGRRHNEFGEVEHLHGR